MKPFRIPLITLSISIALVFAFLLAGPVFAQDELPPAPEEPAVVETVPAVEEAAPAEAPQPAEEPLALPVEEPVEVIVEEVTPPVEEPVEEAAPEIVALDEGGAVLPLATQEAAEVMAEPDPWFTCTIDDFDGLIDGKCSYTGVNALNNALTGYNTKGGSGAIYIEAGTHTVSALVIVNGATVPNLTGIIGNVNLGSPKPILSLGAFNLQVTNTTKGFIIQGLEIEGNIAAPLVNIYTNTGNLTLTDLEITNSNNSSMGLQISGQTGNVTLNSVKIDLNQDQGASIYGVSGNVSINNSSFDSNSQGGSGTGKNSLKVDAAGTITLNGVSASGFRRGNGAWLESDKGITVKNSLFNSNSDNAGNLNNWGNGLFIPDTSKGPVVLDHVYANENSGDLGIKILTNTGGAVTLNTVEARNNRQGIWIDTCAELGGICTTSSAAVSLTTLDLYNNYGNLYVKANGAITGNTITASYANNSSGFGGLVLDNSTAKSVSAVTLNNIDNFYSQVVGLMIRSRGTVTLNHVTSSNSYWAGVNGIDIQTLGAVTFSSTLGANASEGNGGYGAYIVTNGAVSVSKLSATDNDLGNLYIDNDGGTGAVTIAGGSYSSSSAGRGIVVTSRGAITITDTSAGSNGVDGINLDNHLAASAQPVTVKSTVSGIAFNISQNVGYGLKINSRGNITLAGLYVNQASSPVLIDNTAGTGTVTLNNGTFRYMNDPLDVGAVVIKSHGAVTINGIEVAHSSDRGLVVDNCIDLGAGCTTSGTPGVTINGITAENNTLTAVEIISKGAVKITNATTRYNLSGGEAVIKITTKTTSGSVTLDSTTGNYFNVYQNLTNGVWIDALGAVTIKKAQIFNNNSGVFGYGVRITNSASAAISDTWVYSNPSFGMSVTSSGAISLAGVQIYTNGASYGAYLDNSSGSAGVTISGSPSMGGSEIYSNPAYNLEIRTNGFLKLSDLRVRYANIGVTIPLTVGDVTLNNVTVNNGTGGDALNIVSNGTVIASNVYTLSDSGSGLVIDNRTASAKPVTIANFNDSSDVNGTSALYVQSKGAISLTDFYVHGGDTRDFGIRLDNTASDAKAPVTIKKSTYWSNQALRFDGTALEILSDGLVTIDSLYFQYNENGVSVVSNQGGVTLTNANVQYGNNGVNLTAGGAITLTNVYASYNDGTAVILKNTSLAGAPVTVTSLEAYGSGGTGTGGLEIDSQGAVTITDLDAGTQGISGYGLDISTTGTVTIKTTGSNTNYISGNADSGGVINAGGNVSISKLMAQNSVTGSGLTISTNAGSVTITNSSFNGNLTHGLSVTISAGAGAITLTNVESVSNETFGLSLDNHLGTGGITINGNVSDWSNYNGNTNQNIIINTRGAVTMNYVEASDSHQGIVFPALGSPVGNVTMNEVHVNNIDASYGIKFESNGTVSLSHIEANYVTGDAFYIENSNYTAKNVTLLDLYSQEGAGTYGLYVHSKGVISIKDIYLTNGTDGIRTYGVWLDNTPSTASAGITLGLSNYYQNQVSRFFDVGLHVESDGAVSLSGINEFDSTYGIWLDNQAGGAGTGLVTITNTYVNENDFDGIRIRTNGNTTITNVSATNNGNASGMGIDLVVGETPAHFSGTVTLTNVEAYYNNDHEVRVDALRQVTIKDLYAYDYSYDGIGAYITTDAGVSFLDPGGTVWNQIYSNEDGNIVINAVGDVILQKISAGGSNSGSGVEVNTTGKVTVTTMEANNNYGGYGLYVDTSGAISASGLDLSNNAYSGAYLINTSGASAGVTVTSSVFDDNNSAAPYGGLAIETNGAVLLSQVTSSWNTGYGVYIVNTGATATVTVNKSTFLQNYNDGLYVIGRGNITINGITAKWNYSLHNGVFLDNSAGTGKVTVLSTLGANNFLENTAYGLRIASRGVVTISNVTSNYNQSGGIKVDNHLAIVAGTGTVTVTNAVVLHNNNGNGVEVDSNGAITLTSIQAITNGVSSNSAGIDLNTGGNYNALVQNSVVSGNGWNGIRADVGTAMLTVKKTYYMGNNRSSPMDAYPNIFETTNRITIVN